MKFLAVLVFALLGCAHQALAQFAATPNTVFQFRTYQQTNRHARTGRETPKIPPNGPVRARWSDVNVRDYGAKGDGVADDTAAIQAAINFACNGSGYGGTLNEVLFFPSGAYKVSQPSTRSTDTSPVFTGLCANLTIEGASMWNTTILVSSGPESSSGPIFLKTGGRSAGAGDFNNITLDCWNQCIYIHGLSSSYVGPVHFENVGLNVHTGTGDVDNVPLKIANTQDITWKGGYINANSRSGDDVLLTGGESGETPADGAGLLYFDGSGGSYWVGSGIHYDQRNHSGVGLGPLVARNIVVEDASQAILRITSSSRYGSPAASIKLDNFSAADDSAPSLVNVGSNSSIDGLQITNSSIDTTGAVAVIAPSSGSVQFCEISGLVGQTASTYPVIEDSGGNILGDCQSRSEQGFLDFVNTASTNRLRSDLGTFSGNSGAGSSYTSWAAGNKFASLSVDPAMGVMFNTGSDYGYSAQLYQVAKESVDIGMAAELPPTNVRARATTGGSLRDGEYYVFVASTTNLENCAGGYASAVSLSSNVVRLSGSNHALRVSWTTAPTGASAIAGYCIYTMSGSSRTWNTDTYTQHVVGASTPAYTETGTRCRPCATPSAVNTMQSIYHFTPFDFSPTVSGVSLGATHPFSNLHLGVRNYNGFDTSALKANRVTTIPDGNTVLPRPFAPRTRTVLTGLNGATGEFFTATRGQCTNVQTAERYTIQPGDFDCYVQGNRISEMTWTLPDANTIGFRDGFHFTAVNANASDGTVTINRQRGSVFHILGRSGTATSFSLARGQFAAVKQDADLRDWDVIPSVTDGTIAAGTVSLGTTPIPAGKCATNVTARAPGADNAMNLIANFTTDPSVIAGYGVSARGTLTIYKYITSGAVNLKVCNSTATSITPGPATLQWRVVK